MSCEVVHHDDIAWLELRNQEVSKKGQEDLTDRGSLDTHGGHDAIVPHHRNHADVGAVVDRGVAFDPFSLGATGIATGHPSIAPKLVEEDQPARAEAFGEGLEAGSL